MLNQVCVLTIKVNDLEKAVEFYTNILDFTVEKKYGDTIIQLTHHGLPFILEKGDTTSKENPQDTGGNGAKDKQQEQLIHRDEIKNKVKSK